MNVEGRHTVAADRETAWNVLYDPDTLQRILPGCESFEVLSANEFRVTLRLRVGSIVDSFTGTLRLDEVMPLTGFDFHATGGSASGRIECHGRAYLEDATPGHTVLCYEAAFQVEGLLESVTGRMRTTTARAFARRILEALDRQLAMRTRVYTTTVPAPGMEAVTHTVEARLSALQRLAAALGVLLVVLFLRRLLARRSALPPDESLPVAAAAVPSAPGGETAP